MACEYAISDKLWSMPRVELVPFLGKTCKVMGFMMRLKPTTQGDEIALRESAGILLMPAIISKGSHQSADVDHLWLWVNSKVDLFLRAVDYHFNVHDLATPIPLLRAKVYIGCYTRSDGTHDIGAVANTRLEIYDPTSTNPDPKQRWYLLTTSQMQITGDMIEQVKSCLDLHQVGSDSLPPVTQLDDDEILIVQYLTKFGYPKKSHKAELGAIKRFERNSRLTEGQIELLKNRIYGRE
jgi:hypothetical protein